MAKNVVEKIDDLVKIKTILVSVSDKSGLDTFIPGLLEVNPDLTILSTGGTYAKIKEILGDKSDTCLKQVSDYTGQPETQGGLVKTLDFKIYLGLLTETYNPSHQEDLKRTGALAIDMVVVNLYPFSQDHCQGRCYFGKRPGQYRYRWSHHDPGISQKLYPGGLCGGSRILCRYPFHA